jgi:hypothetical protein
MTYMTSAAATATKTTAKKARTYKPRTTHRPAGLRQGSTVATALEQLYAAIQKRHPELPNVVIITGSGLTARGLKLGHFGRDRWLQATAEGRLPELFIAGETLHLGLEQVLETLLHEAVHALAAVRDIADTSRGYAYHNRRFVELAEELGLVWPEDKAPHPTIGFSAVVLAEGTVATYARELEVLGKALTVSLDTLERLGLRIGKGDEEGKGEGDKGEGTLDPSTLKAPRKGKDRNYVALSCGCEKPRTIRAARSVLALGTIRCDLCGEAFAEKA